MSSVCISNCLNDARDPRFPVRATYVNLYKWPESDAEFVRSVSSNGRQGNSVTSQMQRHPRVVDSISCRQMFLRSYTFSREEQTVPEKSPKCFGRAKKEKAQARKSKCLAGKKAKENFCSALFRIFQRFLSCTASVDVVEEKI